MSATQTDLAPQIIRLFFCAGLIGAEDMNGYVDRDEKHKPIIDVLTQKASLESFVDLFNAKITLKSQRFGSLGETGLHESLSVSGMVQNGELLQLLRAHVPAATALLEPMRRDGVISEDMWARTSVQLAESETAPYEWLINEGILSAQKISQWFNQNQNTVVRQAALGLSLRLFRENRLINEKDYSSMIAMLEEGHENQVIERLAREKDLSSARLFEWVQKGQDLPTVDIEREEIDPGLLELFPQSWVRRQTILPLSKDKRRWVIATSDPFNIALAALLHWVTGCWVDARFAPGGRLIDRINQYYRSSQPVDETSLRVPAPVPSPVIAVPPLSPAGPVKAPLRQATVAVGSSRSRVETEIVTDNMSAVQLVSSLIESGIEMRTTDIHIEPNREGLSVRFRIDGELHHILDVPVTLTQSVISRVKVLAGMDVTERRRPQDGHFELEVEDNHFDFRISSLPSIQGEKVVIRILEENRVLKGMEEIGLLDTQLQQFQQMIKRPFGMVLVSGPTGSGKTSTLYSALNTLNSENTNIVTIEDPVEYQLEGITQVQVDPNIGLNFSDGLRSILRQDPDVIMVGEIRDSDTARIAIRAALTGHLVFSTLHTNSALGAVDALMHLGVAPFMMSNSLIGILSQRLVRSLCPDCRRGQKITEDLARQMRLEEIPRKRIYTARGCDECFGSGYAGRTGVFEVITVNEKIRSMIAHPKYKSEELEKFVRDMGMMGIYDAGVKKVLAGETTMDEINRKLMLEL